jgi:hypothetical protein
MKCPKCGYTSFPYLESCRKCGHGLAEQRAALGIYAVRPDPPDLSLAYQAAPVETANRRLTRPLSAPGSELSHLEEIDLEAPGAEPSAAGVQEVGEPADAAPNSRPGLDRDAIGEGELPPVEPSAGGLSAPEMIISERVDLSGLGDITLELDDAADLGGESPEGPHLPSESADVNRVYELDLDDEMGGMTLGGPAGEAAADDDAAADAAYTLEIEEDVEFDIEELELEQDDDVEDDDDDRP